MELKVKTYTYLSCINCFCKVVNVKLRVGKTKKPENSFIYYKWEFLNHLKIFNSWTFFFFIPFAGNSKSKLMASNKTRAALLVTLVLCAYLITETDAHLKIGRKEFRPVKQEIKDLLQDRINPAFKDNKNGLHQRQKWNTIKEIPELYREETAEY